jgi:hypothetical protein
MYRSNAPNKSRRWKYKTRLYDHNYFGLVPATPGKHTYFYTRSQQYSRVENSSEQAGDHSINTRPSYKALSIRRQQKNQQQNKLFPCIM